MQKDWLEDLVIRETMKLIQDDAVIDKIVQLVMDVAESGEHHDSAAGKATARGRQKAGQPDEGNRGWLVHPDTKERLDALEAQKDELTAKSQMKN